MNIEWALTSPIGISTLLRWAHTNIKRMRSCCQKQLQITSNCWHSLSIVTILSSQADIHHPIREGPSPILYNAHINTPDILYTSYTTVNRSFARAHRIDSSEGRWNTLATCFSLFLLFSSVAVLWVAVIIWTLTKVCCMTMLANTADSRSQQSLQSGHVPPNYLTKLVTQRKSCVNLATQLKQCLKYW